MQRSLLDTLDPAQRRAVLTKAPHALVIAGPGSGKTRVLGARYVRLLEAGVPPGTMAALTFTNKAASEMSRRVESMLGEPVPKNSFIGTFHAFALTLLRDKSKVGKMEGTERGFTLIGHAEGVELLRRLDVKNPGAELKRISRIKNLLARDSGPEEESAAKEDEVFALYAKALKDAGALDLDDLVIEAAGLLDSSFNLKGSSGASRPSRPSGPSTTEAVTGPHLTHLLVDEYQDINPPQARLVGLLTGLGASLFAIGDPDQSIYGFRGANLEGFLDFERQYPSSELITLEKNYRSSASVVGASSALINAAAGEVPGPETGRPAIGRPGIGRHGTGSPARTQRAIRGAGEKVALVASETERDEADFIASEIEVLMGGLTSLTASSCVGGREGGGDGDCGGYGFSDFAVLFRTKRQVAAMGELLANSTLPWRAVNRLPDLTDFASHLRQHSAPGKTGKGDVPLSELVKTFALNAGLDETLTLTLKTLARDFEVKVGAKADGLTAGALSAFADSLLIVGPEETPDIEADMVSLMTIHAAKGLEFPVVFVSGCEDGLVPLRRERPAEGRGGGKRPGTTGHTGVETDDIEVDDVEISDVDDGIDIGIDIVDINEERRLLYVAMTRARDRLYLTSAKKRRVFGRSVERTASPFLSTIPEEFSERIVRAPKRSRRRQVQKPLFE